MTLSLGEMPKDGIKKSKFHHLPIVYPVLRPYSSSTSSLSSLPLQAFAQGSVTFEPPTELIQEPTTVTGTEVVVKPAVRLVKDFVL